MAILSTPDFFAPAEVEAASIRLEGASVRRNGKGDLLCTNQDVNKDSIADLVCMIETSQLGLAPDATVANMIARTVGGDILMGQDAISLN